LPEKIRIVEVGPRDGFQNIKTFIPTERKIELIALLAKAGVREMELTSFVSPKAIPQMSDAKEVAAAALAGLPKDFGAMALVPNARGAQTAAECGIPKVAFVISVSRRHNMENVRRTPEESLESLREVISAFPQLTVRLDIATAFVCPFEGDIPAEAALRLVYAGLEAGVKEIVLCDTIGAASPTQVQSLLRRLRKERVSAPLGLHLHDTRGLGLANTLIGLQEGITLFETSVAGLGGCPFAPGAAGNTATEDLLNMLDGMKYETGIDLQCYMQAVNYVVEHIQADITSRFYRSCHIAAEA
jgi:hydroxymethylglutaryl-CoA lyase